MILTMTRRIFKPMGVIRHLQGGSTDIYGGNEGQRSPHGSIPELSGGMQEVLAQLPRGASGLRSLLKSSISEGEYATAQTSREACQASRAPTAWFYKQTNKT